MGFEPKTPYFLATLIFTSQSRFLLLLTWPTPKKSLSCYSLKKKTMRKFHHKTIRQPTNKIRRASPFENIIICQRKHNASYLSGNSIAAPGKVRPFTNYKSKHLPHADSANNSRWVVFPAQFSVMSLLSNNALLLVFFFFLLLLLLLLQERVLSWFISNRGARREWWVFWFLLVQRSAYAWIYLNASGPVTASDKLLRLQQLEWLLLLLLRYLEHVRFILLDGI